MYTMSTKITETGITFIETLWYALASRVVEHAIRIYSVPTDKQNDLRMKFLKRGDYTVSISKLQSNQNKS
jgi:hypothetical protein